MGNVRHRPQLPHSALLVLLLLLAMGTARLCGGACARAHGRLRLYLRALFWCICAVHHTQHTCRCTTLSITYNAHLREAPQSYLAVFA